MYVSIFIVVMAIQNVAITSSISTATLDCTLPCLSPNLQCSLFNITVNDVDVMNIINVTNGTTVGSVSSYSYPTQSIMISNLISDTTYSYCVVVTTINDNTVVEGMCDTFTTRSGMQHTYIVS